MRSKSLKVVLLDGTPYGIKTAELSNWNGKAIFAPRAAVKKLKELPEAGMPAVYFLLGDEKRVYVGETEALGERLAQHAVTKEFWSDLIAFTSIKLTKTEVKYLEYAFTKRLSEDGFVTLENSTAPRCPTIASEDRDAMEDFVDRISDILLSLGYSLLGANRDIEKAAKDAGVHVECIGPDTDAKGIYSENGMLVLKDSIARKQVSDSFQKHFYNPTRSKMIESGILKEMDGHHLAYSQDYLFASASAAAAITLGRPANGMTEWVTKEGKTLKELEQKD